MSEPTDAVYGCVFRLDDRGDGDYIFDKYLTVREMMSYVSIRRSPIRQIVVARIAHKAIMKVLLIARYINVYIRGPQIPRIMMRSRGICMPYLEGEKLRILKVSSYDYLKNLKYTKKGYVLLFSLPSCLKHPQYNAKLAAI